MAFRLRPNESPTDGLRRLARKELKAAREELSRMRPPHDEAIHEARKSVKKVRSIRALIDADRGRGLRGDGRTLRQVNRRLAKLRDADAMLEILRKLRDHDPHALDEHAY